MLDPNEENTSPPFPLGRVVITTNLEARLRRANPEFWEADLVRLISRHRSGDWGDLDEDDQRQNELALEHGLRIFSAYETSSGVQIWIISKAGRSVTTVLMPEDY